MPLATSNVEILAYAKTNNWLPLWVSDGNILHKFLTPSGNILEIYFDKNKTTIKSLLAYESR